MVTLVHIFLFSRSYSLGIAPSSVTSTTSSQSLSLSLCSLMALFHWSWVVCVVLFAQPIRLAKSTVVSENPWEGKTFYTPSDVQANIDLSIGSHPSEAAYFERVKTTGIAWWFDRMDRINTAQTEFQLARDSMDDSTPLAVITIIYDLPNRDCAAEASNGEIPCADAECVDGLNTYRHSYIDPIKDLLADFDDLFFILILEPDSLPNLATNLGTNRCPTAENAYVGGIAYAIETFSTLDNVAIYMDAAHSGWLGWTENQDLFAGVINQVLDNCTASIRSGDATTVRIDGSDVAVDNDFSCAQLVRGFSSNVAGYQPTGCATSCTADVWDACNLTADFNDQFTEVLYALSMQDTLAEACGFDDNNLGWVIDTSRNGVIDARADCSNWCNIDGSGLGYPTQSNVDSITETDKIDAFAWIKVPGESDGVSAQSADRYDATCSSDDSIVDAPEAGFWFDNMFLMLVQNAEPPIEPLYYSSTSTSTPGEHISTSYSSTTSSSSSSSSTRDPMQTNENMYTSTTSSGIEESGVETSSVSALTGLTSTEASGEDDDGDEDEDDVEAEAGNKDGDESEFLGMDETTGIVITVVVCVLIVVACVGVTLSQQKKKAAANKNRNRTRRTASDLDMANEIVHNDTASRTHTGGRATPM